MYTTHTHTHTHTTVGDHRGSPGGARGDAEEDAGLDEEEPASGGPQGEEGAEGREAEGQENAVWADRGSWP